MPIFLKVLLLTLLMITLSLGNIIDILPYKIVTELTKKQNVLLI